MTAAHCCALFDQQPDYGFYEIIAGELAPTATENMFDGQRRQIKSHLTHPNYNAQTFENDICLLTLKDALDLNDKNVAAIALNKQGNPNAGTKCIVSGWGTTSVSIVIEGKMFLSIFISL